MIPHRTTAEQAARIPKIADKMLSSGVDPVLVKRVSEIAADDQGVFDLLELWYRANDEMNELVKDLWGSVHDYANY